MITIQEFDGGAYAECSGPSHEMMLFYCLYQTSMWPTWMKHPHIGESNDPATRQHKMVIRELAYGNRLALSCTGPGDNALKFAVDRCRKLGVFVQYSYIKPGASTSPAATASSMTGPSDTESPTL